MFSCDPKGDLSRGFLSTPSPKQVVRISSGCSFVANKPNIKPAQTCLFGDFAVQSLRFSRISCWCRRCVRLRCCFSRFRCCSKNTLFSRECLLFQKIKLPERLEHKALAEPRSASLRTISFRLETAFAISSLTSHQNYTGGYASGWGTSVHFSSRERTTPNTDTTSLKSMFSSVHAHNDPDIENGGGEGVPAHERSQTPGQSGWSLVSKSQQSMEIFCSVPRKISCAHLALPLP